MSDDDIEAVLSDFRAWLRAGPAEAAEPAELGAPVDLATLAGHLAALRQEVNLQTRASRTANEQNAAALDQLATALGALQQRPAAPESESLRPALKALVDVYDALSLARREVKRLRASLPDEPEPLPPPPAVDVALPALARWLGLGGRVRQAVAPLEEWSRRAAAEGPAADRLRQMVDALLVGYDMSLQRLERVLPQTGLERVPCVGEPFDPETMEVAEVVRDPSRAGTEVIEELRPGYRFNGRLFRYAQVRVARP